MAASRPSAPNPAVDTVYLGGGTPSLLDPADAETILAEVRRRYRVSDGAEITLEVNPGTVDADRMAGFRAAGVNRVSIGAQSFSDPDLAILGRLHSAVEAEAAVHAARHAGFDNVGVDLIFGMHGQTADAFRYSLERAVSLDPEHVSVYALTVHDGTRFADRIRSGALILPDADCLADLASLAAALLCANGYEHYEVSNFAKPGKRCRHNEGAWTFEPYRGFGPSAHSFTGKVRFWNIADLDAYMAALAEGRLPIAGTERIGRGRRRLEVLAVGLRRVEGIGLEWISEKQAPVRDLVRDGLAVVGGGRLRLTEKGFLLADAIAAELA
jgi:oxygen-independent coproporphyrinogen-3 oxidase